MTVCRDGITCIDYDSPRANFNSLNFFKHCGGDQHPPPAHRLQSSPTRRIVDSVRQPRPSRTRRIRLQRHPQSSLAGYGRIATAGHQSRGCGPPHACGKQTRREVLIMFIHVMAKGVPRLSAAHATPTPPPSARVHGPGDLRVRRPGNLLIEPPELQACTATSPTVYRSRRTVAL